MDSYSVVFKLLNSSIVQQEEVQDAKSSRFSPRSGSKAKCSSADVSCAMSSRDEKVKATRIQRDAGADSERTCYEL